jgi:hypothetical protein
MIKNTNLFNKLPDKYVKYIFSGFLLLLGLTIYSLCNIFTFIITCNKYFCYYSSCYEHYFDKTTECFFDKTDGLDDWLILDFGATGIYFAIILILVLLKKLFVKIKKCFLDYKYKYYSWLFPNTHMTNKYTSTSSFTSGKGLYDKFEEESLETDEMDPLIMV